jgi:hypothetical protein
MQTFCSLILRNPSYDMDIYTKTDKLSKWFLRILHCFFSFSCTFQYIVLTVGTLDSWSHDGWDLWSTRDIYTSDLDSLLSFLQISPLSLSILHLSPFSLFLIKKILSKSSESEIKRDREEGERCRESRMRWSNLIIRYLICSSFLSWLYLPCFKACVFVCFNWAL